MVYAEGERDPEAEAQAVVGQARAVQPGPQVRGPGTGITLLVLGGAAALAALVVYASTSAAASQTKKTATRAVVLANGQSGAISVNEGASVKIRGALTRGDTGAPVGGVSGWVHINADVFPITFDSNGIYEVDMPANDPPFQLGQNQVTVGWNGDATLAPVTSWPVIVTVSRQIGNCNMIQYAKGKFQATCSWPGTSVEPKGEFGEEFGVIGLTVNLTVTGKDTNGDTVPATDVAVVFRDASGTVVDTRTVCTGIAPNRGCYWKGPVNVKKAASATVIAYPSGPFTSSTPVKVLVENAAMICELVRGITNTRRMR